MEGGVSRRIAQDRPLEVLPQVEIAFRRIA